MGYDAQLMLSIIRQDIKTNMADNRNKLTYKSKLGLHIWWQCPKLRTDEQEDKERKATWMELFYDLVYVAVISQLSHKLSADVSIKGVFEYAFLFMPVWLMWRSSTFYNERFEVYDVRHRIFTFLKMIPIAGLAYSIHDAFGKTSNAFIISYIVARLIITYMWLSAGRKDEISVRRMAKRFALGSGISVIFWIASLFVYEEPRFILLGIGMLVELITPIFTLNVQRKIAKISYSHMSERFGLFVIICITETIIAVVNGVAKVEHLTLYTGLEGVLGLILAFGIWWVYFDHVTYRPFRYGTWLVFSWSNLHILLIMGITAVGAGTVNVISNVGESPDQSTRLLLCGAFSLVLFMMGVLGSLNEKHDHQHTIKFDEKINIQLFSIKFIAAIVVILIGIFAKSFNDISLLSILAFVIMSIAIQGLYIWVKAQMPKKAEKGEFDESSKQKSCDIDRK